VPDEILVTCPTRYSTDTTSVSPGFAHSDVEDVVRMLRIGRNTVCEIVGSNEIPHRRVGKQIRFRRER